MVRFVIPSDLSMPYPETAWFTDVYRLPTSSSHFTVISKTTLWHSFSLPNATVQCVHSPQMLKQIPSPAALRCVLQAHPKGRRGAAGDDSKLSLDPDQFNNLKSTNWPKTFEQYKIPQIIWYTNLEHFKRHKIDPPKIEWHLQFWNIRPNKCHRWDRAGGKSARPIPPWRCVSRGRAIFFGRKGGRFWRFKRDMEVFPKKQEISDDFRWFWR